MQILLDECVPKRLRKSLVGHGVKTVTEMGWSGTKNGALLSAMAAAGFEVLLTVDQNLRHQQNLAAAGVAVVVLAGTGTRNADLLSLIPALLAVLKNIRAGDVVEIDPLSNP